jgi:hypothetical protein
MESVSQFAEILSSLLLDSSLSSGKLAKLRFDRVEVRKIAGAVAALGILNDAVFVDDEGGTLRDATHVEIFLREEAVVGNVIGFGDFVLVVTEEVDPDALFLFPVLLGERIVAADAEDLRVEVGILGKFACNGTELGRADAGEGHGDKKEKNAAFAELLAELDDFRAFGSKGGEFKIWGGGAYSECHGDWVLGFGL